MENGKWSSVAIEACKVYGRGTYFRQAIQYKDSLFFIGGHYPAILKMNLPSCKLIYLKKAFLNYEKRGESGELYFRGDFVCKDNILYLASGMDNTVLIYHLDTQTYRWVEVGKKENRYSGIMWDGNNYWLSPRKNTSIVKWNGNDHVIEFEIPEEKKVNNIAYAGIVKRNNQIIIPALAGSGADTIILTSNGAMEFDRKRYFFYKMENNGDCLAQDSDGRVLFISAKGIKRQYECELSGEKLSDYWDTISIDVNNIAKEVSEENDPFSLNCLLKVLGKNNIRSTWNEKNVGHKMWEKLKL